jgi:hypothetical protein
MPPLLWISMGCAIAAACLLLLLGVSDRPDLVVRCSAVLAAVCAVCALAALPVLLSR